MQTEQTERQNAKHKKAMQKQKAKVDARIQQAQTERGLVLLLTGNGKGKTSSGFGMVMRALGYGQRVGVVQFIKGAQLSGEEIYLRDHCPQVAFHQMDTGFTWDTQDRTADMAAAQKTWGQAAQLLAADSPLDLLLLDELTYMLAYKYLDEAAVLEAIAARPAEQTVVITGRGGGSALQELADTVSEVKEVKHAFKAGLAARRGVDF
ncbi:MAG: cob(I)yrinic acid a,c-diamide adenosyltransferase [Cellvibrionales bacterium]|nr:cob(I)yrinic acid a,c-diamide adenosyltransferase [Cellvibrionales bacterium]